MSRKSTPVRFPTDLRLDLDAFCEAHYGASMNRVIEEALRRFIEAELAAEPSTKRRFLDARRVLGAESEALRLVTSANPGES